MVQDLSPDVKKFLLYYKSINQQKMLAEDELIRVYRVLEGEIVHQSWFSSIDFNTKTSWKWLQVWKKNWQASSTNSSCPWVHFEYTMSWTEQWVLASVDIELLSPAFKEAIQDTAKQLHQALLAEKPKLLKSQGWMLRLPLEANRMILLKRINIIEKEFSAEWIVHTGKELLNQLSEIIPIVDQQLYYLFGEGSKGQG